MASIAGTARNVGESLIRPAIKPRVQKAEWRLALREESVVDQRDDGSEGWAGGGCSADGCDVASPNYGIVVATARVSGLSEGKGIR